MVAIGLLARRQRRYSNLGSVAEAEVRAEAQLELSRHLDSGESLKWSGVPKSGVLLRGSDVFLIPFSFLWGGFAVFWEFGVITSDAPFFFMLWGIPFVLVGLYITVGRFFVDARRRARSFYGVTDRRVIILSGLFSRTVNTLPLKSLSDISLKEKPDRSGTIYFGRPHPMASWVAGMQWPGMGQYQSPSFELIQNAKEVHDLVLEAQRAAA